MNEPLIRDIPSIKNSLNLVKSLKAWNTLMPLIRPLFQLLGVDTKQIDDEFAKIGELEAIAEDLSSIPDRFNDLFSQRGWIIYETMNLEEAKKAIERAESGDIDGAETDLVDYYNAETLDWKLMLMSGVKAFRPRIPLAEKALIDYSEERYHACIPVVLALLDGMINDLHERQIGFFAQNTALEAWDSIAAHSKGLTVLANHLRASRNKTTTDIITIPYRNGILHGRDLGYGNRIVAAKTWAALFAARDWAIRVEQGLLTEPPEKPTKTWGELFQQILENGTDKKLLESWEPREIRPGTHIPFTGEPKDFIQGTPEYVLIEFLCYWKARNYGRMAEFFLSWLRESPGKDAGRIRNHYALCNLKSFEIVEVKDETPAVTEIKVKLCYERNGEIEREVMFRLVNEDTQGNPAVRGKTNSRWCVANWGYGVE